MLVLQSTHKQMVNEAKAAGAAALNELVGELTRGLQALALRAEPKPGETTSDMVLRYLREEIAESTALRIELFTAQRERDEYRERLLRFTAPRQRGPGGRFVKVDPAAAAGVH
jgi:hypothetical protein